MDTPHLYEIRVAGRLTDRWAEWFDGLALRNEPGGVTVLTGCISDQAALLGLLGKLQALNLTILAVIRGEPEK